MSTFLLVPDAGGSAWYWHRVRERLRGRRRASAAGGRHRLRAALRLRALAGLPTTVLAGRDDRFFPLAFQRRVARERLGVDAEALPGGHPNALSRPEPLTRALLRR